MAKNWIPISGTFHTKGNTLVFDGREVEWEYENEKRIIPLVGTALNSTRFSGGDISATVEFENVDEFSTCELMIYYDPKTQFIVTAGLGGFGLFSIRYNDGKKWIPHKYMGDRENLLARKEYTIKISLHGSNLTLNVDDVDIFTTDVPINMPESQVGIWCMGKSKIYIKNFKVETTKPSAFVIMQFSSPFNEVYKEVLKIICKEFGLNVVRADEEFGPGIIIADVTRKIMESKVIIAEITPANQNVYYELGYAHAKNKPTILIAEKPSSQLPFDVSAFRVLFYENSIQGKAQLEEGLRNHLKAILTNP